MARLLKLAATLSLLLATAACATRQPAPQPPSPPVATTSVPAPGSVAAFEQFAGLALPAAAGNVSVRVTTGPTGRPAYRLTFNLPSDELDRFCAAGQLDRPSDVVTVPASYRRSFDYRGGTSAGVSVSAGSLPRDPDVQREVLAVGTEQPVAEVRVYAYTVAR